MKPPALRTPIGFVGFHAAFLLGAKRERVFITHSGCSDAVIADVRAYLEGLGRFEEILVTRAGCVISSHCGPATLGVLFIEGE